MPEPLDKAWASVVARRASADGAYQPGPRDQGNSTGNSNTIRRVGTGEYVVTFPGVYVVGGPSVYHVSALSGLPRACSAMGSGEDYERFELWVRCTTRSEVLADTASVASYLAIHASAGKIGYFLWDRIGVPDMGARGYNSAGGGNSVHMNSAGAWMATLTELGANRGNVQVTATTGEAPPITCHIVEWHDDAGDLKAAVPMLRARRGAGRYVLDVHIRPRRGPQGSR